MLSLFTKKEANSCTNCIYYSKENKRKGRKASCSRTHNDNLKTFPFKNTKCKSFINKFKLFSKKN